MSGATPPRILAWPSSGSMTPAIILSSVLLPLPLPPTRPTASPLLTSKEMLRRAQNVSLVAPDLPLKTISRSDIRRRRER